MARVIIVGAGISGLATAAFLDGVDTQVFEASDAPGGNVRTDRIDGRILDRAANGWLDSEPAMAKLLDQLNLTDQIIPVNERAEIRWIYADGKMQAAPLSPREMLQTSLIPWWAKLRILVEPFIFRVRKGNDETVAEFVSRRLGRWFVDRFVGPMVAGIHAARPEDLSLKAAFPKMAAMEQEYGSLFRAMLAKKRGGVPSGHLQTLQGGAGQLTDTLAQHLGERLLCDTPVEGLSQSKDGWVVHTKSGEHHADAVVLACPAPAQAKLMRGLDAAVAEALDAIEYAPVTVVVSVWAAGSFDQAPKGFGVLVARGEDVGVLGTLFTSCAFPQQCPEGEIILRTIVGGAVDPKAAALPHEQLLKRVFSAQEKFLGTQRAEPILVRVYRHEAGIPQYAVGHTTRTAVVDAAEAKFPGLFFAGNHLNGIGVKDCAGTGHRIAQNVQGWLEITASIELETTEAQ
jgi:oxygen-dependent protoporphyrinogen oxidase